MSTYDIGFLLNGLLRSGGSDLHLCSGTAPAMRVDGTVCQLEGDVLSADNHREILASVLSQTQIESLLRYRELDCGLNFDMDESVHARFRCNCAFEKGGLFTSIRALRATIPTTQELMLPAILDEMMQAKRGLFLITGPTGSGKSTTLAALIQQINATRACNIVTIEDPIEYIFKPERSIIRQREVGIDTHSFAEALRRVLRQDPDVIMIGEMRDCETIGAAITAAETGHLVLATLHTPDAARTIDRMIDVFPSHIQSQIRVQIAEILLGVCSQQLLPCAGGGRIAAAEILLANAAVRNCIREAKTTQLTDLMQTGAAAGMRTMDQAIAVLVFEGRVSRSDAFAFSYNPRELGQLLG